MKKEISEVIIENDWNKLVFSTHSILDTATKRVRPMVSIKMIDLSGETEYFSISIPLVDARTITAILHPSQKQDGSLLSGTDFKLHASNKTKPTFVFESNTKCTKFSNIDVLPSCKEVIERAEEAIARQTFTFEFEDRWEPVPTANQYIKQCIFTEFSSSYDHNQYNQFEIINIFELQESTLFDGVWRSLNKLFDYSENYCFREQSKD